jgi:hypothetical protein
LLGRQPIRDLVHYLYDFQRDDVLSGPGGTFEQIPHRHAPRLTGRPNRGAIPRPTEAITAAPLGYFDLEQKTLQPLDNPFGTRLSPVS